MGECTSIEDCEFDVAQDYDYAQTALVDEDKKHIIYWNDNIHDDPNTYIAAFIAGLSYANVLYQIKQVVMLESEVREKFSGVRY